jgi:hypothetical protein
MATKDETLSILRLLVPGVTGGPYGPGSAARVGGSVWDQVANENPDVNVGAAVELANRMQSDPIDFDAGVVYIPGERQDNRGLAGASPEDLESFIRQSEQEHAEALNKYMNDPNIPKDRAARLGIRNEEGLAKWWNDHDPRRAVTPTSSCIKRARIGSNGDIYITFGSNPNKEYQYEGSPDPVQASKILADLVGHPGESIGQRVNSWKGDWGMSHTYLPKG